VAWRYLTDNLRYLLPAPWLQVVLLLVSVLCGAIVGGEREKREKPAGLRTLILVCMGSTAFTLASFAFITTTGDSGRVAAQIVTGIGFLGAGAILHSAGLVRGMTTAATIWATAATGMIAGIGYAGAALGTSILVRLVLGAALALESRAMGNVRDAELEIRFDPDGGKSRAHIEKLMEDFHVPGTLECNPAADGGSLRATVRFRLSRRHRREFLHELASLAAVRELNVTVR
jgi:putative Mg2+ transporter-C (MgtC) family protein